MNGRFESKRGLWLVVWSLVVLVGVALVGLAFYSYSYQGPDTGGCLFGPCYSQPYAVYGLPLLSIGFLAILWGSAYVITIIGSRKR